LGRKARHDKSRGVDAQKEKGGTPAARTSFNEKRRRAPHAASYL
jgi:hypothetical protein